MKMILSTLLLCITISVTAQQSPTEPAYKRYPTVPALQLLLGDSTTKYTKDDLPKKTPVLLMIFSPECDHCQHEAEQIVANKEALQNIHIVMATTYPIYQMKAFAETYGLASMKNVVMGRDPYYLLPSFYEMHNFPYLALYDKKGNLIRTFEGSVGIDKVLQTFKEAK
ncbi:MAG TPA: redoxin domain-containing protein [Flavisolibacter sp.]|nr:redoxin domain-containing protein [Flavisolibacter sp.]